MQDFTEGQTLADLYVEGQNLAWYSDEALTNELPENIPLEDDATYYVVATEGLCNSAPLEILVSLVLGTVEFESAQIAFYPNPVKEIVTILNSQTISSISVHNLSGQLVMEAKPNSLTTTLDVSGLFAGFYLLDIVSGNKHQIVKIAKQ